MKTRLVTIARLIRIIFGTVAGLMLILAVSDVMLTGHLSIITPASFGALLTVALAFLISNLLNARETQQMLARRPVRFGIGACAARPSDWKPRCAMPRP